MNSGLRLDRERAVLWRGNSRFDSWALAWVEAEAGGGSAGTLESIQPLEAVTWLHGQLPVRRVPVAVIGPKDATTGQLDAAAALGGAIAQAGFTLLTGGRGGVMEAASRGAAQSGGLVIGIVPEESWRTANAFVSIPLASGIGPARNVLIARGAFALVAVGGGYGTLSEMAFGLHFGRPVLALENAPPVDGSVRCSGVHDAMTRLASIFLGVG